MHTDIEETLRDVADQTERPYCVVEQIFRLLKDAAEYGTVITIVDDQISLACREGEALPTSIDRDIVDHLSDIRSLHGPIQEALQRRFGSVSAEA